MTMEEIFKTMQDLIAEQFAIDADEISMDSSFVDDLGADSVDLVELVMAMEEEFDIGEIDEHGYVQNDITVDALVKQALSGSYRTVVLVPAAPGATTPVGGILHQPTDSYVEVSDGVAAAWPRTRTPNGFDSEASISRAVAAIRDRGLADL